MILSFLGDNDMLTPLTYRQERRIRFESLLIARIPRLFPVFHYA
jgi:hypothetical protein